MPLTGATRPLGLALAVALGAAALATVPAASADSDVRAPRTGGESTKPVIRYDDGPVRVRDQAGTSYELWQTAWPRTSLTYGFTNTTPDLGEAATKTAVAAALDLWADASALDFAEAIDCGTPPDDPECDTPDIRVLFDGAAHGSGFGEEGGVLAHAFYPPPNGVTLAGDAHFDEGDNWAAIDLLTVAAHEFGHSLGIRHADEDTQCPNETGEYALMCPFYVGPHQYLGADDIAAIQSLYGGGGPPPPPPEAPANDDFADAETLVGSGGSTATSSVNATKEAGEPAHAGNSGGHSVWYSWVAPDDGTLTVDTYASGFDTLLGVYTGAGVGGLAEQAANDDSANPESLQSEVEFDVVAGTTYRIAVDGYGGQAGNVALDWQFDTLPESFVRPDAHVRRNSNGYVGDDVYNGTGAGQTRTALIRKGRQATFWVRVQNDGNVVDSFKVTGSRHGKKWGVAYFAGTKNISKAVKAGTYRVNALAPGATKDIRVVVTAKDASKKGNTKAVSVTPRSVADSAVRDTVKAIVKRR